MPENNASTEFLKKFAILFLVFVVMSAVLITLIKCSQKSWDKGLRTAVIKVLSENEGKDFSLGNTVKINSSFATSCGCFEISGTKDKAIIIRLQTIAGSAPAVFKLKNGETKAQFIDFAIDSGRASHLFDRSVFEYGINYWENKIPLIFAEQE